MELPEQQQSNALARILVVEDEPLVRTVLADWLRDEGFQVVEAASGEEALSIFHAYGPVDLLLTDVQMPGAMDGYELARAIHSQVPGLPILITSGNAAGRPVHSLGTFISKPYRLDAVASLVFSALGMAPRKD